MSFVSDALAPQPQQPQHPTSMGLGLEQQIQNSRTPKGRQSSTIPGLSVGDVRKCFNQIRRAVSNGCEVKPEHLLWNGMSCGDFALKYVIGHHTKRTNRRLQKNSSNLEVETGSGSAEEGEGERDAEAEGGGEGEGEAEEGGVGEADASSVMQD
jgi:hypothetical protein